MGAVRSSFVERAIDTARAIARRVRQATKRRPKIAMHGHTPLDRPTPFLDTIPDAELARLNKLLPWNCFTVDSRGRAFGAAAWSGKRQSPQPIPDERVALLDRTIGLAGAHVLEIGCFEGVHTTALCERAGRVTAIDSRVENVVKTVVRCNFYGQHPQAFVVDVDDPDQLVTLGADVCFHVGVLYHLADPVRHLRELLPLVGRAVLLDTHVATDEECDHEDSDAGLTYRYKVAGEFGRADPFSGMAPSSRWLQLTTLRDVLGRSGFSIVHTDERVERNGHRVLLIAERDPASAATGQDDA